MKVYLAARYSRIGELNIYASQLQDAGHEITSRWVFGTHSVEDGGGLGADGIAAYALEDYFDLSAADTVVTFTEEPRSGMGRGGRHVEFGMAVALGKRLVVVGPMENIFHALPQVEHFPDWDQARSALVRSNTSAKTETAFYTIAGGPVEATHTPEGVLGSAPGPANP